MKELNVKQGSDEWIKARLALPTASNFDRIITAKGLKASAAQDKYLARLAAEWFLGVPIEDASSGFMQRGTAMEAEAVAYYELETGLDTRTVGLCLTDDGIAGASPDRLVGDDGLLEIKCPGAETHMEYLLFGCDDYVLQVQGQLWVTGRQWCDRLCYHPVIPSVISRLTRDDRVIEAIAREVGAFAARLAGFKEDLATQRAGHSAKVEVLQDSPF